MKKLIQSIIAVFSVFFAIQAGEPWIKQNGLLRSIAPATVASPMSAPSVPTDTGICTTEAVGRVPKVVTIYREVEVARPMAETFELPPCAQGVQSEHLVVSTGPGIGQVNYQQPEPQVVYICCDRCSHGYRSCSCGSRNNWRYFDSWDRFGGWYGNQYGYYPSASMRSSAGYSQTGMANVGSYSRPVVTGSGTWVQAGGYSSAGMQVPGGSWSSSGGMRPAGSMIPAGSAPSGGYAVPQNYRGGGYSTTTIREAGAMVGTGGATFRASPRNGTSSVQSSGGFLGGVLQVRTRVGQPRHEVHTRVYNTGMRANVGGRAVVTKRPGR